MIDFQSHIEALRQGAVGRLDANETIFFERELERIEQTPYDVLYPELKARKFLPLGSGLGPADKYNTWRQFDKAGFAVEGSMESDDIPEVEIAGSETVSVVVPVLIGYSWTFQDIRESSKVGRPLDAMKAEAARAFVEKKFELLAACGSVNSATNKIFGLLNQPNVPHIAVSTGTSTAGFTNLAAAVSGVAAVNQIWGVGGKSPKEIVRDLNNASNQVVTNSNGVHRPNKLILDLPAYQYVNTTQMNDADASIYVEGTVLQYIRRNCEWLQGVDWWLPCGAAPAVLPPDGSPFGGMGSTGTAKTRAMLYEDMPRNLKMFIPQEFEQFAPQFSNYKVKIPCHARFGGTVYYYPRSAVYIDGIGGA